MQTTNLNTQVKMLTEENVRLYEENMKLKLMLGKNETSTKSNKTTNKKSNKNNAKNNTNTKSTSKETKTVKNNKKNKTNNENKEQSKFQKEREAKKAIVAIKRAEKVPVQEIAKLIHQSEPTVRNYIRELKVEGKITK